MFNARYLRFSLRTILLVVAIVAVALWWFVARPRAYTQRQIVSGHKQIHERDHRWLDVCFDQTVRDRLVTVLGDSRLSHWGRVRWLFAPDNGTIISYGDDNALIVWNRSDGSIRNGYFDVAFAVRAIDAGKVFMGDSAGNVRSWSISENSFSEVTWQVPVLRNPACAASPDGAYFAYGPYGGPITIWDASSGQMIREIDLGTGWPESVANEDWGPILLTHKYHLIATSPKYLAEFSLLSGEHVATVNVPATSDGSSASIFGLKMTENEEKLLVADAAGRLMAFNWEKRTYLENLFEGPRSILDFTYAPDGNSARVVCGDGVLRLEFSGGRQVSVRPAYQGQATSLGDPANFLIGTGSGRIVVLNGDDEARLRGGPRGDAVRFAYAPRGDRMALAGRDGRIMIRETATWTQCNAWSAHYGAVSHLEWSPDGQQLISFGADRVVAVWSPGTGTEVAALKAFAFPSRTPSFDSAGGRLVLQNLTRESLISLYDVATWTEQQTIPQDAFHPRGPVLFSIDGTKLFAGGSSMVQVWDLETNKLIGTMGSRTGDEVRMAINPDGKVLYALTGRTVEAFDVATYTTLWSTKLNATRSFSVAVHPHESLLVVGDNEGAIVLLDALSGKVLTQMRIGPTRGEIQQVGFNPDGQLLTAAMSNGAVVVMRAPKAP